MHLRQITVLLVDDHEALREGLALLLRNAGLDVVATAESVEEGFRRWSGLKPDVTVVDLHLRDALGTDLVDRIHAADPHSGILIHTGTTDQRELALASSRGVRGIALKSSGVDALARAIRTVADGGISFDASLAGLQDQRLLTAREREILGAVARGSSYDHIGQDLHLSAETVRTHLRNAAAKLGATNRANAVALAISRGEIESPV